MKNKYKYLKAVSAALCLFWLGGCTSGTASLTENQQQELSSQAVAILEDQKGLLVFEAREDLENVQEALKILQEEEKITWEGTEDSMGLYLQELNGVKADAAEKTYWAFYTDLLEKDDVSYATLKDGNFLWQDHELGYALYGLSSVPFVKGHLYALVLETY